MTRFPRMGRAAHAAAAVLLLAGCADQMPTGSDAALRAPESRVRTNLDATPSGHIRIGVVESASSVPIGAEGDYSIRDKATGDLLLTGTGGSATVTLDAGSRSVTHYRLQVMCGSEAAVNARQAAAAAQGYATYKEPIATCTRLFLGEFASNASFSIRNAFRNEVIAKGLAGTDSFWKLVTQVFGVTRYKVERGEEVAISTGPVVLSSTSAVVTIAGRKYRGVAEVRQNAAGTLSGVNEVPFEQYLWGVVPRELPPTVWPQLEAQKAQAVAARTYAASGMGKRKSEGGYDLRATTSDQVYGGFSAEHPISTRAVNETAGVVATYEGRLISALFSSTTGGHTSSNEEVYNSAPVPYLRGVPDAQRGQAFAHVPSLEVFKRHANPTNLRAAAEGDFEADWSRYHRWVFEWTAEEMARVITEATGASVTRVSAINVLERGPSGRVLKIEYVTDAGTFYEYKDRIRSSLRYVTASGGLASLRSTLFFIEPVTDPRTKTLVGFKAYGGGWGHGVGLSQTGAAGMAEKGRNYEEILKHYYQGITLETR